MVVVIGALVVVNLQNVKTMVNLSFGSPIKVIAIVIFLVIGSLAIMHLCLGVIRLLWY